MFTIQIIFISIDFAMKTKARTQVKINGISLSGQRLTPRHNDGNISGPTTLENSHKSK